MLAGGRLGGLAWLDLVDIGLVSIVTAHLTDSPGKDHERS
jgi:hypothetical protein